MHARRNLRFFACICRMDDTISYFSNISDSNDSSSANSSILDACEQPFFALTPDERTLLYIVGAPQTFFTILFNVFVLSVFASNKDLQHSEHFYYLNLAVCDLIVGMVSLPSRLTLDIYGCWPTSYVFCRLYKILDWIGTGEAGTTMVLISWSRYRMITMGAQYQNANTARKLLVQILISWIINIFIYAPALFMDKFTGISITGKNNCKTEFFQNAFLANFLITVNNTVPPVAVVAVYTAVFWRLRWRKELKRSAVAPTISLRVLTSIHTGTASFAPAALRLRRKTHNQGKALFILASAFLLTSCPCGLVSIMMFAINSDRLFAGYLWTLYLLYFNSFLNTIIYTYKVPAMRKGMKKLLPGGNFVSTAFDNGPKTKHVEHILGMNTASY